MCLLTKPQNIYQADTVTYTATQCSNPIIWPQFCFHRHPNPPHSTPPITSKLKLSWMRPRGTCQIQPGSLHKTCPGVVPNKAPNSSTSCLFRPLLLLRWRWREGVETCTNEAAVVELRDPRRGESDLHSSQERPLNPLPPDESGREKSCRKKLIFSPNCSKNLTPSCAAFCSVWLGTSTGCTISVQTPTSRSLRRVHSLEETL